MCFNREKVKDFYLLSTDVENIFINEYMAAAPGDYVKVYLYGLLYSQYQADMTYKEMAKQLGLSEKQIEEAWDYWAGMGVVEKHQKSFGAGDDYDIEFKQLRSLMYGRGVESEVKKDKAGTDAPLYDSELKELLFEVESIMGKPLSAKETREVFSWVSDLEATKEVISSAIVYCLEKGKDSISYISKVIAQWTADGLKTEDDVKMRLETLEQNNARYKSVLHSLGLSRGVTKAEKEIIDRWFDEMGFNMERVEEACCKGSFIPTPNIRYVNGILEKWYEEAKSDGRSVNSKITVTQAVLNRYYEHLRRKAEEEAEARKQEVYTRLPRIEEIDGQLIDLGKKMSKSVLGGDLKARNEAKRLMNLLEEERAVLLTENNFREDYTDIKYSCSQCSDTGLTEDGQRCSCVKQRIGEAEIWQNLSSEKR